jgi:outer membrane protein TolC
LRIDERHHHEGNSSNLDELLAQRNLFGVEQSVPQIRAQLLVTEVAVYRARWLLEERLPIRPGWKQVTLHVQGRSDSTPM